jgi:hypothetical protein
MFANVPRVCFVWGIETMHHPPDLKPPKSDELPKRISAQIK